MRTYVITGAASGIGKATSELLQERGHAVIGVD
ncbi:MAG: short-chain dehydrogenase, partial [Actinobacteria bacterium]|nr:short-chain dehydrogenase [Actinomycetota bacterium]